MRFLCGLSVLLALLPGRLWGDELRPPDVLVESPVDYQVFQRQTRLEGALLIRGHVETAIGRLQYRLIGTPRAGKLDDQWHSLSVDRASRVFNANVPALAGGWYSFELAAAQDGRPVILCKVDHVGIGEVFVIAGQSNSTNYGKPRQHPASGKVSTFDGRSWRIADDPQPGVQDRSQGGSFIPAFGDALVERLGVPVGVACVGAGGTSVREWLPEGERMNRQPTTGRHIKQVGPNEWESTGQLFDVLVKRMKQLGPTGFRSVLWHQGESDTHQPPDRQISPEQYKNWLTLLIHRSRQVADVPWFVAQATYHTAADPRDDEFRAAQQSLWEDETAQQGPDTDQLGPQFRSGVHFNDAGLKAHGRLWAQKVGDYLEKVLAHSNELAPPARK